VAINLGLDIGAVGLKLAAVGAPADRPLLDELCAANPAFRFVDECEVPLVVSDYRRVTGSPIESTYKLLHDVYESVPESRIEGIRVTGSGSRTIAKILGIYFENEFKATAHMVSRFYPDARTVFEIGGESSRYMRLERAGDEQESAIADYERSGECAAGTGSFLDQQALRLGYSAEEMGDVVQTATASKLLNWAALTGYRGDGPHVNPCDGISKYREMKRKRYLTPVELVRLGCALRVAELRAAISPTTITAIRLLLLTGARVSEILSLRWREVDLVKGLLTLPDSKTGAKTIHVSAPAVDILKAWPRFAGSPYVFPGEGHGTLKGQHRVSLVDPWAWLRRRAKIADVRLHDLRHSYASVAVSSGQSLPIVGALLGHSQAQTTMRYAHLMDDPLRAASDATGATIAAGLSRRAR
jgi:integrase